MTIPIQNPYPQARVNVTDAADTPAAKPRRGDDPARSGAIYLRAGLVSVALALVTLVGLELYLRDRGAAPDLNNNADRWSLVRAAVGADTDPGSIALIGSSRMQAGISLATLSGAANDARVYQLAVSGEMPYATLTDLAENTEFRGLVLVSLLPVAVASGTARADQLEYVNYHARHWNWARALDTRIGNAIEGRLALLNDQYSLLKMVRNLRHHQRLVDVPHFIRTDAHREMSLDFTGQDMTAMRRERLDWMRGVVSDAPVIPQAVWEADVATDLARLAGLVEARGGRVVFLYLPTSDEMLAIEAARYPRDPYWKALASAMPGRVIHFRDVAAWSDFNMPDTSHIASYDKAAFTTVMSDLLKDLGVLLPAEK